MNSTIKNLIERNNKAFKGNYQIETVYLSYIIIVKLLKHLMINEKTQLNQKTKLGEIVKSIESAFELDIQMHKKIKRSTIKMIIEFNNEFKSVNKELKFQYPELKLEKLSKKGMHIVSLLHTNAIKYKNNNPKI